MRSHDLRPPHLLAAASLIFLLLLPGCLPYGWRADMKIPKETAGQSLETGRYLIFIHSSLLEQNAWGPRRDRYGFYLYQKILSDLHDHGFTVLSEVRERRTNPVTYAAKATGLVRQLLEKNVAPERITVAGLGKGGRIAFIVSTMVNQPGVNYVILGGCARGDYEPLYDSLVREYGGRLEGRFLSIRARDDQVAGSCGAIFNSSAPAIHQEVAADTAQGHGVFYQPNPCWIEPLTEFAKGLMASQPPPCNDR